MNPWKLARLVRENKVIERTAPRAGQTAKLLEGVE